MKYLFQMYCPRCQKRSSDIIVTDKRKPPALGFCQYCRAEGFSSETKVLAVEVTESTAED